MLDIAAQAGSGCLSRGSEASSAPFAWYTKNNPKSIISSRNFFIKKRSTCTMRIIFLNRFDIQAGPFDGDGHGEY